MEKNTILPVSLTHCLIRTQYVYSKNNNVFVKIDTIKNEGSTEWSPINFQWTALMESNKNLK